MMQCGLVSVRRRTERNTEACMGLLLDSGLEPVLTCNRTIEIKTEWFSLKVYVDSYNWEAIVNWGKDYNYRRTGQHHLEKLIVSYFKF